MSETPTVAEQAAAPPPDPTGQSDGRRPERQPLAFLLTHQSGVVIVVALVIALAVGALLIRLQGVAPLYAYETLIKQALFVPGGLTRTLQKTAPLVLTGLAVVLPLRVGLFNIGGQGQLIFGAMFGAWVAYAAGGYGILGAALGMVAGIVGRCLRRLDRGCAQGAPRGARGHHHDHAQLHRRRASRGGWSPGRCRPRRSKTSGIPQTELIPESAQVGAVAKIPIGFVIAVVLAVACWWMLSRSTLGFRFNTVGANKHAARYAGINITRIVTLSMVLGGGLAGLAGALEAEGTLFRFEPAIGGTLGFDGITIALLARANPLATIPAAFLVGVLRTGAAGLQFETGIAPEVVDVLLAIILLMVSIPVLGKWIFRSRADKVSAASTSWGN